MTHGITFDRPPEPIVELVLRRAEADTLAEAVALALWALGALPLEFRDQQLYRGLRGVRGLLATSDRLDALTLPLTPPLLGAARAAVHAIVEARAPGFGADLVPTPGILAWQTRCRALDGARLAALVTAFDGARALVAPRFDAAVRLN